MLKVSLSPSKPGVQTRARGVPYIPNIETKFLDLLASRLGKTYSLVVPADGEFGSKLPNGSFTGVIGLISRGEADMAISYMAMTETRSKATNYSVSYGTMEQTFVVSKPALVPKVLVYAYPLQPAVWGGVCIAAVTVALVMKYAISKRRWSLVEVFIGLFGNVFRQPLTYKDSTASATILFGVWLVFAWMVGVFYSATLLSFLSVPLREKGIDNTEEMIEAVEERGYRCLVPKGSFFLDYLLQSPQPAYRELGLLIREKDWHYDVRENFAQHLDEHTVLVGHPLRFQGPLFDSMKFSEDGFGTWNVAVMFGKTFCCKRRLDRLLLRAVAAGFYQKIVEDEVFKSGLGFEREVVEGEEGMLPLTLQDMFGVFVLLWMGYLLSLAVLCAEMWISRYEKEDLVKPKHQSVFRKSNRKSKPRFRNMKKTSFFDLKVLKEKGSSKFSVKA